MKQRAIFLDRDGTLNEEVGYLTDPSQFRIYDFAVEAVRTLNEQGWPVFVITNQSGIARGLFDEAFLQQIHRQMLAALEAGGARIDAIYYCPHHPESEIVEYRRSCECRKPGPGMLQQAAETFDLDLTECFVIGDRYSDVAAAHGVGGRGILLLSGHGTHEVENNGGEWPRQPDHIAANLLRAVEWIIETTQ